MIRIFFSVYCCCAAPPLYPPRAKNDFRKTQAFISYHKHKNGKKKNILHVYIERQSIKKSPCQFQERHPLFFFCAWHFLWKNFHNEKDEFSRILIRLLHIFNVFQKVLGDNDIHKLAASEPRPPLPLPLGKAVWKDWKKYEANILIQSNKIWYENLRFSRISLGSCTQPNTGGKKRCTFLEYQRSTHLHFMLYMDLYRSGFVYYIRNYRSGHNESTLLVDGARWQHLLLFKISKIVRINLTKGFSI